MLSLSLNSHLLISSPLIPSQHRTGFNPSSIICKSRQFTERGLQFDVGDSFFRQESATGRDLGVLSAALFKESNGSLRVLDGLCGCGIRSLRYLVEAEADFVLANDANEDCRRVIEGNLSQVSRGSGDGSRWVVTHTDANRLMAEYYLQRDYFDLIDIDSFGSDSSFLRTAISTVKLDGLLYVTSTDGFSSGGHRPQHSLAAYGAYIRPMPYSNEVGLRMLIGGAVREASVFGYRVEPLFSYYSYHGPVFRVMLQVKRGKLPDTNMYNFISYCTECGDSNTIGWDQLGQIRCPCNTNVPHSLIVSGPLWTGPLHQTSHLKKMLNLAERWGWISNSSGKSLKKLLELMIDESDPNLPFGYLKMDEVSRRVKLNSPSIEAVMNTLHKVGYAASRSHITPKAIKTNCRMAECLKIVEELQQCSRPVL
ncbi:OLC1v1026961C1 [Oldenlandia corymbosa var. corymbosa]|uniref:OLC1v1026961C1 n=1 Tax=Oldenlandia corymbosa var. corymbosa TaxID=529605 RepID=A0AAV1C8C3_OLDCO|nr:OLC1v1026961C1 [Oldenlandia corymbosa var. corymbosa]